MTSEAVPKKSGQKGRMGWVFGVVVGLVLAAITVLASGFMIETTNTDTYISPMVSSKTCSRCHPGEAEHRWRWDRTTSPFMKHGREELGQDIPMVPWEPAPYAIPGINLISLKQENRKHVFLPSWS